MSAIAPAPSRPDERRPPSPGDDRAGPRPAIGSRERAWRVFKRACVRFYDDQMTQHAGALTYYALMSLFPVLLLALSLLGLVGEYPRTYDAVVGWLAEVAPAPVVDSLDSSLRAAFQRKDGAATALVVSILVAFYGTTGVLESARRALNVVFDIECGRTFLRRKLVDVGSTFVLMLLILATVVLVVIGGTSVRHLLGNGAAAVWSFARWPAALLIASLVFAWLYYVTADREHRRLRLLTPGSVTGVVLWLGVSALFSEYITGVANVSAIYGAFAGAIVLVAWLWLTGVAILFGAQIDAALDAEGRSAETAPPPA